MAIILFLMDTSGSMNQRTCLGPTYLDYGKIAVHSFLKIRDKNHLNWKDRHMLVTCEDFPAAIKVGWRDSSRDQTPTSYFKQELNKLVAVSMTNLGGAIKCSLDLLNLHRVHNGLDNYGQGRNPYLIEPAVVVVISDGCRLTNTQTVTDNLTLPMQPTLPGCELTKEPFRWDQRIFSIVLRFKGNVDSDFNDSTMMESHFKDLCEITGGKSYLISTQKSLYQALESINQKVMTGVVLNLEKLPSEAERNLVAEAWHSTRRMIFVKPNNTQLAHWPIPENFWPVRDVRPVRSAIPTVHFKCENKRVNVLENLPFDKYELEPSPLTQYILEMRQPNMCWQTFVKNSCREKGIKAPFGYLKASIKGTCVSLFVMPFNYPQLFPMLEELIVDLRMQPTNVWISEFKAYIASLPQYYYGPLRVALRRLGVPGTLVTFVPDPTETSYLVNYMKSLKAQAKTEANRYLDQTKSKENKVDVPRKHVSARDVMNLISLEKKIVEEVEIVKNPFHSPRDQILTQLSLLRKEIGLTRSLASTESLQDARSRFNLPLCKMGLYQEAFNKNLRTVDLNQRNSHMFGNPFKLGSSKKQMSNMVVADVDELELSGNNMGRQNSRKRQLPLKPFPAPPPPSTPPVEPASPQNNGVVTPPTPLLSAVTTPPPLSSIQPPSEPPPGTNAWKGLVQSSGDPKSPSPAMPKEPPTKPKAAPLPNPWVFKPSTGTDIAAAISSLGSGNDDKHASEPPPKRPKTNNIVKENNFVSINPSMKESFLKFSDTEGFMDKNKIKDNFGGDLNGDTEKREVKQESDYKSKRTKITGNHADAHRRDNKKLKDLIVKEIRKPGKKYDHLFNLLNQVKGTPDAKREFADGVILEGQKFKKKSLIEQLKSWQKGLTNR